MRNYLVFLWRSGLLAFVGDWRYYTWMGVLTVFCLLGLNAYAKQFACGLISTGMSDEVSWGVYIANFTFLVAVLGLAWLTAGRDDEAGEWFAQAWGYTKQIVPLLLAGVLSVLMRVIVFLFGPERLRRAAEYGGAKMSS